MTTTVTTHSSSVRGARLGSLSASVDSCSMSPRSSLPSSPVSVTGMSGLLNSRHLVQDEKLVVATLATLNSGSASNLIKQDLKWIIQSRRKAEGKGELQVEFKKPVKDELTSEELIKRARRRELNRLAARRSREKGQKRKDMLVEEIRKLQSHNSELVNVLGDLRQERNSIVLTLRQHMKQCSDYHATQTAAVGMSQRVLDLLGFSCLSASSEAHVHGAPDIYICPGDSLSSQSRSQSPAIKHEQFVYSSPASPLLAGGIHDQLVEVKPAPVLKAAGIYDDASSLLHLNIHNPQASYSVPVTSCQFESPPVPSVATRLRLTQVSTPTSISAAEEDEVVQYKHKLMKHRKQFSEMTESGSVGCRGIRAGLERSFSFPSTVRETRSSVGCESSLELKHCDTSIAQPPPAATATTVSGDEGDRGSCPLNLAIKRESYGFYDSSQHLLAGSMDTWPPAGMRASARYLDRRWSVDNQSIPEPLNLSSKDKIKEEEPRTDGSSCDNRKKDSKYSNLSIDPYR